MKEVSVFNNCVNLLSNQVKDFTLNNTTVYVENLSEKNQCDILSVNSIAFRLQSVKFIC